MVDQTDFSMEMGSQIAESFPGLSTLLQSHLGAGPKLAPSDRDLKRLRTQ